MTIDLTRITKEDIKRSAEEAVKTPIVALKDDDAIYSNALYELHMGEKVVDENDNEDDLED